MNLNTSPSVCFIVKACLVYGGIAFAFSMLGTVLPGAFVIGNPFEVSAATPEHIIGHIIYFTILKYIYNLLPTAFDWFFYLL